MNTARRVRRNYERAEIKNLQSVLNRSKHGGTQHPLKKSKTKTGAMTKRSRNIEKSFNLSEKPKSLNISRVMRSRARYDAMSKFDQSRPANGDIQSQISTNKSFKLNSQRLHFKTLDKTNSKHNGRLNSSVIVKTWDNIDYSKLRKRTLDKKAKFDRYGEIKGTRKSKKIFKNLFKSYRNKAMKLGGGGAGYMPALAKKHSSKLKSQLRNRITELSGPSQGGGKGSQETKSLKSARRDSSLSRNASNRSYISQTYHGAGENKLNCSIDPDSSGQNSSFLEENINFYENDKDDFIPINDSLDNMDNLTATKIQLSTKRKITLAGIKTLDMQKMKKYDEAYEMEIRKKQTSRSRQIVLKTKKMLARGIGRDKVELVDMMRVKEYMTRSPMIRYVKQRYSENRAFV